MAGHNELTDEQRRMELAELMWLNYFNQVLYEQGLITETERNKMKNTISRRRPSRNLR